MERKRSSEAVADLLASLIDDDEIESAIIVNPNFAGLWLRMRGDRNRLARVSREDATFYAVVLDGKYSWVSVDEELSLDEEAFILKWLLEVGVQYVRVGGVEHGARLLRKSYISVVVRDKEVKVYATPGRVADPFSPWVQSE